MSSRSARTTKRSYSTSSRVVRVRRTRIKKKKSINYKKVMLVIVLFSFSALLIFGFIVYKQLSKELVSADSPTAQNVISQDIVTVLYASSNNIHENPVSISSLILVFMDKDNKKTVSYEIPVDYEIDAPGKFGVERLDKLIALGSLDCEDSNCFKPDLLVKGVEKIFGVKIDRFLFVDNTIKETTDKMLLSSDVLTTFNLAFYKELPKSLKTNLSAPEVYNLYKFIKSLPEDRFIKRSLTHEMLTSYEYIDDDIQDITFDSVIARERLGISVLNGNGQEGAAAFGARVVNNISAHLLALTNASRNYDQSVIIATSIDSSTVKYLTTMFKVKNVYLKTEASGLGINENEIDRSDIVLILGQDSQNAY